MEMIELKVSIEAGRFDALKYFMSTRENTDPQKALEKTLEEMYEKHVPPDTREYLDSKSLAIRWAAWILLFIAVLLFGIYGPGYDPTVFIYREF